MGVPGAAELSLSLLVLAHLLSWLAAASHPLLLELTGGLMCLCMVLCNSMLSLGLLLSWSSPK